MSDSPNATHGVISSPERHDQTTDVFPVPENVTYVLLVKTSQMVDDQTAFFFKVVLFAAGLPLVSLAGVVSNVINMVVFRRQGIMSNSSTTSLFCMAISDFFSTVTGLWIGIAFSVVLADPPGLNFDPFGILMYPWGEIHILFASLTRSITAYIALERCLCVVFPFKAKTWFNSRRSLGFIVGLFIFVVGQKSPLLYVNKFDYWTNPVTNKTIMVLVSRLRDPYFLLSVQSSLSDASDLFSIGIVLISTTITVSRVKLSKAWRESVTKNESTVHKDNSEAARASRINEKKPTKMVGKEERLVRLVTVISVLLLVCYIPHSLMYLFAALTRTVYIHGPEANVAFVLYSFAFFMDSINSSVNILVYYKLSSSYRREFDNLRKKASKANA